MAISAYRASVNTAKERGAFEIFDAEREKNNPFINRLKEVDSQLYYEMLEYGRRNIALLTIAPTGTTSLMTQTSSGIEPVFMPVYKRRRKVNPNDKEAKVDFIDEVGDSWEEYHVFHHQFVKWLDLCTCAWCASVLVCWCALIDIIINNKDRHSRQPSWASQPGQIDV